MTIADVLKKYPLPRPENRPDGCVEECFDRWRQRSVPDPCSDFKEALAGSCVRCEHEKECHDV